MELTFAIGSRLSNQTKMFPKRLAQVCLLGGMQCGLVFAQVAIPSSQLVTGVEAPIFSSVELEKIKQTLGLQIGSPLKWRNLDEGIRVIGSQTGIQSLFIDAEPSPGGIRIQIRATRLQTVSKVTFTV